MHETRIANDVGSQYCRQPAFDPDWPLLHHDPQSNLDTLYDETEGMPRPMSVVGTKPPNRNVGSSVAVVGKRDMTRTAEFGRE
jgi:hypothetical protein